MPAHPTRPSGARLCIAVALTALGIAVLPAAASADAVPGQLVVGFHSSVSSPTQKALIERAGGKLVRRLAHIRGTVVRVRTKGLALSTLRKRLRDAHGVRYAEPDYYLHRLLAPDDPNYPQQYALAASGAGA